MSVVVLLLIVTVPKLDRKKENLFHPSNTLTKRDDMILIVASKKDTAGLTIKQEILNHYPLSKTAQTFQQNPIFNAEINGKNVTLATLNEESVNAQNLPESFPEAKLIVFISRHSSASGKPTLSVHTPGNFAEAGLGGLPRTVSVSPATAMRDALQALFHYKEELSLNYEVSYECTHHGPSLNVPTLFVELGSSPAQWSDSKAAQAVAHSAICAIANFSTHADSAVLGIGGTHYNQKFTHMALSGEAIFGHMIPKYAVSMIDSEILAQCIKKTLEKVSSAILDWKGIRSQDKPKLLSALQDVGLTFKKV
ncbi:MAG: D-aminoacyl-tRNA deacylase [Candidatus Bathyarchaeia archaeon]